MLFEGHFEKAAVLATFLFSASGDPAFDVVCPGERQTLQMKAGRTLDKDEFAGDRRAPEVI
jgi:hypothetical protein